MSHQFAAPICKLGTFFYVDVPPEVSSALSQVSGKRGYVPVVGTVNGQPLRGTLTPKGGGEHRLFLNGKFRKQLGVGAQVGVSLACMLALDEESREVAPPADLAEALRENELLDEFSRYSVGKRAHIITWLDEAKKEETRWRRIEFIARRLFESAQQRAKRAAHAATKTKRTAHEDHLANN